MGRARCRVVCHERGEDRARSSYRSGQAVPMIPAIELFCGMGGATEGMTRAGVTVIAAVDKWSAACDAHR